MSKLQSIHEQYHRSERVARIVAALQSAGCTADRAATMTDEQWFLADAVGWAMIGGPVPAKRSVPSAETRRLVLERMRAAEQARERNAGHDPFEGGTI